MEISEIKEFLRIDTDDEDSFLNILQKAAEEYILNAGVAIDYTKYMYKLAILMLIGHWYENRAILAVGHTSKEFEHSFLSIITQLKYSI